MDTPRIYNPGMDENYTHLDFETFMVLGINLHKIFQKTLELFVSDFKLKFPLITTKTLGLMLMLLIFEIYGKQYVQDYKITFDITKSTAPIYPPCNLIIYVSAYIICIHMNYVRVHIFNYIIIYECSFVYDLWASICMPCVDVCVSGSSICVYI